MSDNRDFSRLATNPSSTDAVNAFNDLASEADGALSASLAVAVTNTNTVTITRAQLKSVTRIVLQEGSPVTTDTITVFVNNDNSESPVVGVPLGRFTVINETANSARFYLVGGSSPSGTDLIPDGVGTAGGAAAALIDVLADDVVSVGGGTGGGGGGAAPVDSVFGRTGVVVAESGDYNATQVSFTDPIAGSPPLDNVDEALVYCLNNLGGGGGGGGGGGWSLTTVDLGALGASLYVFDVSDADDFELSIPDCMLGASEQLWVKFSTDGGSTFRGGASDYPLVVAQDNAATQSVALSRINLYHGNQSAATVVGFVAKALRLAAPVFYRTFSRTSDSVGQSGSGSTVFNGPITHVRIESSAGTNFSSGTAYFKKKLV